LGAERQPSRTDAQSLDPTASATATADGAAFARRSKNVEGNGIENITWSVDNTFYPEGTRLFNPTDFRDLMAQYPILWIGDSTMRRADIDD
jgi:hypothetical protein